MRAFAGDRIDLTLVAPDPEFTYRPLAVAEPFALGHAYRVPLSQFVQDAGADLVIDATTGVDDQAGELRLRDGAARSVEALLVAPGARAVLGVEGATTWWPRGDPDIYGGLLRDIDEGYSKRIAIVVPPGAVWPLPAYELTLMTAGQAKEMGHDDVVVTVVTPERRALSLFGDEASEAVSEELRKAGVELKTGAVARRDKGGLVLEPGGQRLDAHSAGRHDPRDVEPRYDARGSAAAIDHDDVRRFVLDHQGGGAVELSGCRDRDRRRGGDLAGLDRGTSAGGVEHVHVGDQAPHEVPVARTDHGDAVDAEVSHRAGRLLPAALLLAATARAAREFPDMNGFFEEGARRPSDRVHLGVAIAMRGGGLIAPAILDADQKRPPELMDALRDLVARTRRGGLRGSELSEPTITVTSLGDQGVTSVFGVIYPPQVALVGFGRVEQRPWAEGGMVGARSVVSATLAADHRVSDGHLGGLFLAAIDGHLQRPEEL